MAKTTRAETARRNMNSARVNRGVYVEGSAARRLAEVPERHYPARPARKRVRTEARRPQQSARPKHQTSQQALRNREKAMGMSQGFVVFLAIVSAAILFCAVNYLQYKSEITGKMRNIATLESELAQLKEDNNAYYSQVTSMVDLERIKKIAIGRLGMKYPAEEQIVTYQTEGSSYVRQYQDIPDSK